MFLSMRDFYYAVKNIYNDNTLNINMFLFA